MKPRQGAETGADAATVTDLHRRHLAAIVARRDTSAFVALFNHFAPRLKAYMKRLGTADDEAEDLAQEAMLTVWRKAASYDPARASTSAWIFTIARNLRIDALRRGQRRALDLDDPLLAPAPLAAPDAEATVQEQQQRIRVAVRLLPPEQAEVVALAFYEGHSHGAIAARLKIPLGTAKSRLRLAFARLRLALADDAPDDAASPPPPASREAA
jgi:RNA polymerase sigma-70 factor, ECF subfamily